MKSNSMSNNINNSNDWILNFKFKINFDIIRAQNLSNIKGLMSFTDHYIIIKLNEEKKRSFSELIKNLFHPIYFDEENNLVINYSFIEKFQSQNGIIEITINNPITKMNINMNISSIEKNNFLFNSSLKVEEINNISKFLKLKIVSEIKHLIEEFLIMINIFKDILDKSNNKNILLEEKIIKAINETKKYYEKNIKELKKQNHIKNDINKKILKDKINSKQVDRNSISLLSQIEPENYASFELILPDLKNRGSKLLEENINLFFEITSLENNILNLKKVDKSKVSDNLKNIQTKNLETKESYYKNNNFNPNSNKKNNYYNSENNYGNNKIQQNDYQGCVTHNSNIRIENKKKLTTYQYKDTKKVNSINKSFDDSPRFSKNKNECFSTDLPRNNINKVSKFSQKNVVHVNHEENINKTNKSTLETNKDFQNKNNNLEFQNKKINTSSYNQNYNENNFPTTKLFRMESDTITDVNGLFEDINYQNNNINYNNNEGHNLKNVKIFNNPNSNYDSNNRPSTPNIELILSNNKFNDNYFFEENENVSSSTKTNSKKEEIENSNNNDGINYITNLKELKEIKNLQAPLETPKFFSKNATNIKKTQRKEIENINIAFLTNKINSVKVNHLFAVNNCWNNVFFNSSEYFCRKYFEFCFEEFFPKLFILEKDINGIFKTEAFYSYLFYLRSLKNYLFTDENKIQFSNVFFYD